MGITDNILDREASRNIKYCINIIKYQMKLEERLQGEGKRNLLYLEWREDVLHEMQGRMEELLESIKQ